MKLIDTILVALCVGFFMIGVSEVMSGEGNSISERVGNNYGIFMLSLLCLFGFRYIRAKRKKEEQQDEDSSNTNSSKKKK